VRLLPFQLEAVELVEAFDVAFTQYHKERNIGALAWASLSDRLPPESRVLAYSPVEDARGRSIPTVAIAIPTGGGKTIVGLDAAMRLAGRRSAPQCIVWMVPTRAIYEQTLGLMAPDGELAVYARDVHGRELIVKRNTDAWALADIEGPSIPILLMTQQSVIGGRDDLRVRGSADMVAGLPYWTGATEPSLLGLLEILQPIVVVDEAHRVYTQTGRDFFRTTSLASFILEMTATPKAYSAAERPNVLVSVPAHRLVEEQLIKTPLRFEAQVEPTRDLLARVIRLQRDLEGALTSVGYRVRPKALISTLTTGDQFADRPGSAQAIRDGLIELGVEPAEIAIKSATQDDLTTSGAPDSPDNRIAFIITKTALMEGWDCKSVYVVALLNEVGATQTTVQLVGRGLRQPNRRYFTDRALNELHVLSNSPVHHEAVSRLKDFLENQGLTPSSMLVLAGEADRQVRHTPTRRVTFPVPDIRMDELDEALFLQEVARDPWEGWGFDVVRSRADAVSRLEAIVEWHHGELHVQRQSPDRTHQLTSGAVRLALLQALEDVVGDSRVALSLADRVASEVAVLPDEVRRGVDVHQLRSAAVDVAGEMIGRLRREYFRTNVFGRAVERVTEFPMSDDGTINLPYPLAGVVLFRRHVLGDVSTGLFNGDELSFARFLDGLEGSAWIRNIAGPEWLGFPMATGRFYPDFVVVWDAIDVDNFRRAIFIETKGAHLVGSEDTEVKREACEGLSRALTNVDFFLGSPLQCQVEVEALLEGRHTS